MSYEWKGNRDWQEHKRKCRIAQTEHCSDNLYERMRVHIIRIVRESEGNVYNAAETLGRSESTIRRYMKFVSFEHLMRDPALADRFDWRSMTSRKWAKLLKKHPDFISRLPRRNCLLQINECEILLAQPQLAKHFDLQEWNRMKFEFSWSKLLQKRPKFASECDFSVITERAACDLLSKQPQFFDRIRIEPIWPYHWKEMIERQPQILDRMESKPHSEWPFNFKVFYLRIHPEFESEFMEWDKIDWVNLEDIQREQPELYIRHYAGALA